MLLEMGLDRGFLANGQRGPFRYNLRSLPFRAAVGAVSPGYLGIVDDFPYWNAAFDLYRKDDVSEALRLVETLGIGTFADYALAGDMIWIEAATGAESEIVRLGERLEIEFVRADWPDAAQLQGSVAESYRRMDALVGPFAVDTLVTVVKDGIVVPTAQWKDGYFTPKERYGKICVPFNLDQAAYARTVERGLVYQQTFELSGSKADLWLLEAATAMLVKAEAMPEHWLDPKALQRALTEEDDSEEAIARCEDARLQARTIGARLMQRGGTESLIRCLELHTGPTLNGTATDHALKSVYGIDTLGAFFELR